jgi:hypothetical protein
MKNQMSTKEALDFMETFVIANSVKKNKNKYQKYIAIIKVNNFNQ